MLSIKDSLKKLINYSIEINNLLENGLPVANGGTGATTSADALENLGISDYVIETGTINGWTYRKWNSGVAECWKIAIAYSSKWIAWGNLYYAEFPSQAYPFTFVEVPCQKIHLTSPAGSGWECTYHNSTTATGIVQAVRNGSATGSYDFRIHMYVHGRWK